MLPSMNASTRFPARVAIALLTAALCACGGGASTDSTTAATTTSPSTLASVATPQPTGSSTPSPASTPVLSTASQATRLSVATLLFEEKGLSASGQQACSSCHTDSTAHADPAGTVLPMGGLNLAVQGFRSTPSLLYLESNEAFSFDANGQPKGGFTWDGRADSRAAQAALPLLDASEMANTSVQSVAAKVRKLSYFQDFATLFGLSGVSTDQQVFDTLLVALQAYQQQDPDYLLFNSKFDRVLDGQDQFSPQEARGLAIFNDPA
jgi:cytochrome c peroxidase